LTALTLPPETIIRSLQPFGPDYSADPLYILQELWNTDKHRLLNTCVAYPQGMSLIYSFPDGHFDTSKFVTVPADVKDGTELFRERLPALGVEVMGEGAISLVVFDKGLVQGQPVDKLLTRLVEFSGDIIDRLAKTV
jgi:hypothetical protein